MLLCRFRKRRNVIVSIKQNPRTYRAGKTKTHTNTGELERGDWSSSVRSDVAENRQMALKVSDVWYGLVLYCK